MFIRGRKFEWKENKLNVQKKFDDIRHEEDGIEYWYARELMTLLDYIQWRNFENVVKKGMLSCKNNGISVEDHCWRQQNGHIGKWSQ